jgi:hypothetical protein
MRKSTDGETQTGVSRTVRHLSIGGGLRLFDANRKLKAFGLKHSRAVDNGVLILEYQAFRISAD